MCTFECAKYPSLSFEPCTRTIETSCLTVAAEAVVVAFEAMPSKKRTLDSIHPPSVVHPRCDLEGRPCHTNCSACGNSHQCTPIILVPPQSWPRKFYRAKTSEIVVQGYSDRQYDAEQICEHSYDMAKIARRKQKMIRYTTHVVVRPRVRPQRRARANFRRRRRALANDLRRRSRVAARGGFLNIACNARSKSAVPVEKQCFVGQKSVRHWSVSSSSYTRSF